MNLPKVYEPSEYESNIYALWEKGEAFKPSGKGEHFSIVVPPPNANGDLHIGHALTLAIEDVAIRYNRLKGKNTLFLPGADHAGFETQSVYEKHLAKEGKSRFDFSREELYSNIWDFVAQNRENYKSQFRRLGASVDWGHLTFTLDDKIIRRAYATFKKMWDEGLIYRGERLVNFCTFHGTAFADIEVVHDEVTGNLWHIRYPLTDGSGEVVVATTRPETMLGDTAVAVHPEDERYKTIVGKTAKLPLTHREIPVIADSFVDQTFGSGAVKITPAHDINDYDAGTRHDLPKIQVIDHEGKITHEMPEAYRGMKVEDARKQIVKDLEEQGFLVKTEQITHNVGHCYKCGTVIEPLLREQWFVDMQPLAQKAIQTLEAGEITFYPDAKRTQLINYLHNLRDWNISRQIAWGIPIPAFQSADNPDEWIYDERVESETIEVNGKTHHRDPDVFDTWFSSGQWPFATLDFPDSEDYKQFYPLSLMETGFDILMPWVSRMLMLGLFITGEVPFKNVYLHGLVLDEHGQKMSKSKGNVVSPLTIVDQYGSDALRMGLLTGQSAGNNQPFSTAKVVGARNFCNKLWNIARYIEANITDTALHTQAPKPRSQADHWILARFAATSAEATAYLDSYRISEAYDAIYHFVWDDFADWYIEVSKADLNESVMAWTLKAILQIAHPFAPFVTETIWQTLQWETDDILAKSHWPESPTYDASEADKFETIKTIVAEAREVLHTLQAKEVALHFSSSELIASNAKLIARLSRVTEASPAAEQGSGLSLTSTSEKVWLAIDVETAKNYRDQLDEKKKAQEKVREQLEARLNNKAYVERAPENVVAETRQQLAETLTLLENIDNSYKRLKNA